MHADNSHLWYTRAPFQPFWSDSYKAEMLQMTIETLAEERKKDKQPVVTEEK